GTMAGTVAALLDPASLDDPDRFATDVITVVFPGAVSQALRQVGIRAGEELTKTLIRKVAGRESVQTILRVVARLMGWRVGQRAVLGKDVPIVGIGIGFGWNWLEVGAVGKRAIAYFTGQPIGRKQWGERVKQVLPDRMVAKVWRSAEKQTGLPPLPPVPPALPGPEGE
ncbi:MAG TPA: hypothetical protein VK324_05940, partial [Tepidisphaeraceae bacterium]|nr:hypothetical protein [Tepidisphaeraceae bacterium]